MGSDLMWLSFRYVTGELPEAEALAFEDRLAAEQAAREAVAEAVALVGSVASLPDSTPTSWRHSAWHPIRWTAGAAALAASLALAVALRDRDRPNRVSDSVALAWSDLREPAQIDLGVEGTDEAAASEVDTPPSWMFEAATLAGPGSGEK